MRKLISAIHSDHFMLLARLSFGAFIVMTSAYCLLAYVPFTYHWVIKCPVVAWVPLFAKYHSYLYWVAFGMIAATLLRDLRKQNTRRLARGFILFHSLAGLLLLFYPMLANLGNDGRSLMWGLVALFPLFWIAALDHSGYGAEVRWEQSSPADSLRLSIALRPALFLSLLYVGLFLARALSTDVIRFEKAALAIAVIWSLFSHLLVFMILLVALKFIRSISNRLARPKRAEFILCNALAAAVGVLIIRKVISPAISFDTYLADLFAILFCSSVVAYLSGVSVRLYSPQDERASTGLGLALWPLLVLIPGGGSKLVWRLIWISVVALLAYLIPSYLVTMDWVFLLQKLSVISVWVAAFAFFYMFPVRKPAGRQSIAALLVIVVAAAAFYKMLDLSRHHLPALLSAEGLNVDSTLEEYSDYDLSFRVAQDILQPRLSLFSRASANNVEGDHQSVDTDSFYAFLKQNTNLSSSTKVSPVEVNLVKNLQVGRGDKPNVFIFVIDSLRADYLSPYNRSVKFTPAIESFARESVVMKNAFTHYGGTVLSEPSIWVGAMQLHKQYIEPFYPMNSLQRLVEAEGYESMITVDPVLKIILKPSDSVVELDKDLTWFEYDSCRTFGEIQARLAERAKSERPVFVYAQPQNLHTLVLTNHKAVGPGQGFPGFYEHYASQVQKMDHCFGEFIAFLKEQKLYDNSVIIVTSDHGDSLGEGGRWGHGYTIFPEVIRIPLIIHLPKRDQHLYSEPSSLAFSTDVTPSLYYLLGHRPVEPEAVFGRPLFTETEKEHDQYLKENYLVASSYGAVYGILSDNGRRLFISDAINRKDYYFDLGADPKGTRNQVSPSIQAENRILIRDHITAINHFYNFDELP